MLPYTQAPNCSVRKQLCSFFVLGTGCGSKKILPIKLGLFITLLTCSPEVSSSHLSRHTESCMTALPNGFSNCAMSAPIHVDCYLLFTNTLTILCSREKPEFQTASHNGGDEDFEVSLFVTVCSAEGACNVPPGLTFRIFPFSLHDIFDRWRKKSTELMRFIDIPSSEPRRLIVHMYVLCGSQNKQRLFPYTALTVRFL
jgi:hypothetical protein